MTFAKTAAYQFQQLRLKKMAEEHEAERVCLFEQLRLSSVEIIIIVIDLCSSIMS